MKTIRTILATFGVTTALYGLFALIAMRVNPAFVGRSIYQLFRDTGFVALVIGIGCILSFIIMTVAIVSFRDDGGRKKHEFLDDDEDDDFLEEETVPEERAEEADESWSPEIKRKQRRALRHTDEEPTPDLFGDDEPEDEPIRETPAEPTRTRLRSSFRENPPAPEPLAYIPEEERYAAEDTQPAAQERFAQDEQPAQEPLRFGYHPEEDRNGPAPLVLENSQLNTPRAKKCVYCGKPIDADSAFCIYCGKRV